VIDSRLVQAEAAATFRFGAAESQGESPCGAIHKFKDDVNCEQLKLAPT